MNRQGLLLQDRYSILSTFPTFRDRWTFHAAGSQHEWGSVVTLAQPEATQFIIILRCACLLLRLPRCWWAHWNTATCDHLAPLHHYLKLTLGSRNRGIHVGAKWTKSGRKLITKCGKSLDETGLKSASFLAVFALILRLTPQPTNCKTATFQNSQLRVFCFLFYFSWSK